MARGTRVISFFFLCGSDAVVAEFQKMRAQHMAREVAPCLRASGLRLRKGGCALNLALDIPGPGPWVIQLMDKILHDPKEPKLWELWYIPYNG